MTELLMGTRKGLVVLRGDTRRRLRDGRPGLPGRGGGVRHARPSDRALFRRRHARPVRPPPLSCRRSRGQVGASRWADLPVRGKRGRREHIPWVIEPGEADGEIWCGVAPAALFRSGDNGETWALVEGLWNVPERPHWEGGAGGLCLHSICPWPGDPKRLAVGHLLRRGVWLTEDGG